MRGLGVCYGSGAVWISHAGHRSYFSLPSIRGVLPLFYLWFLLEDDWLLRVGYIFVYDRRLRRARYIFRCRRRLGGISTLFWHRNKTSFVFRDFLVKAVSPPTPGSDVARFVRIPARYSTGKKWQVYTENHTWPDTNSYRITILKVLQKEPAKFRSFKEITITRDYVVDFAKIAMPSICVLSCQTLSAVYVREALA